VDDDRRIDLRIGTVRERSDGSSGPVLSVSLVVYPDGSGHVRLDLFDLRSRRSGESICMGTAELQQLHEVMQQVNAAIEQTHERGQLCALAVR